MGVGDREGRAFKHLVWPVQLLAPSALKVIANMAAAYKRERKSVKRKARALSSLSFKVEDNLFGSSASTPLKKLKKDEFMSFKIETVLPPEQSMSGAKKTS